MRYMLSIHVISMFVSIRIHNVAVKEKFAPKFSLRTKKKLNSKKKNRIEIKQ